MYSLSTRKMEFQLSTKTLLKESIYKDAGKTELKKGMFFFIWILFFCDQNVV